MSNIIPFKSKRRTFYFNTGVKPENRGNSPLPKGHVIRGTVQIPFDCDDVPEGAKFLFGCDHDMTMSSNMIKREIHNSVMVSKFAYFAI